MDIKSQTGLCEKFMVLVNKHPVRRHLRIFSIQPVACLYILKQYVTDEVQKKSGAKYTISTIQLQYTAKTGSPCLILLYRSFLKV